MSVDREVRAGQLWAYETRESHRDPWILMSIFVVILAGDDVARDYEVTTLNAGRQEARFSGFSVHDYRRHLENSSEIDIVRWRLVHDPSAAAKEKE